MTNPNVKYICRGKYGKPKLKKYKIYIYKKDHGTFQSIFNHDMVWKQVRLKS